MDLDHVALATRDVAPALDLFVGELGGIVLFGGQGPGFRPMQVCLGDETEGMKVELLEPWDTGRSDFLERFLARHGEGPHHLTFKVPDLDAVLERVRTAGFEPVGVDRSDPDWQEAFLHPREAHGTVVQLAQAHDHFETRAELLGHVRTHGPDGHPRWWPEPRPPGPRRGMLRRVVVATPSLPATLGFFAGLLGGQQVAAGEGWVELAWPIGGGRVRLEHRPGAAPGIDRLEGDVDGPAAEHVVAGTRLRLAPRED